MPSDWWDNVTIGAFPADFRPNWGDAGEEASAQEGPRWRVILWLFHKLPLLWNSKFSSDSIHEYMHLLTYRYTIQSQLFALPFNKNWADDWSCEYYKWAKQTHAHSHTHWQIQAKTIQMSAVCNACDIGLWKVLVEFDANEHWAYPWLNRPCPPRSPHHPVPATIALPVAVVWTIQTGIIYSGNRAPIIPMVAQRKQ